MRVGETLRVHGEAPFTLRWSSDNWKTVNDSKSKQNALQIDYVDLKDVATKVGTSISFTFLWTEDNRWEGQNYEVTVH
jgi:glucoamylase